MAEESSVPRDTVARLAAQFAGPRAMRRGSVSERWMKCNKSVCACAADEQARHGPYYSLTWAIGGETHSRMLNAEQAAVAREQIDADREFRKDVEAYRRACEQWADEQLTQMQQEAAGPAAAKKGGLKQPSRRRSSPRSRR